MINIKKTRTCIDFFSIQNKNKKRIDLSLSVDRRTMIDGIESLSEKDSEILKLVDTCFLKCLSEDDPLLPMFSKTLRVVDLRYQLFYAWPKGRQSLENVREAFNAQGKKQERHRSASTTPSFKFDDDGHSAMTKGDLSMNYKLSYTAIVKFMKYSTEKFGVEDFMLGVDGMSIYIKKNSAENNRMAEMHSADKSLDYLIKKNIDDSLNRGSSLVQPLLGSSVSDILKASLGSHPIAPGFSAGTNFSVGFSPFSDDSSKQPSFLKKEGKKHRRSPRRAREDSENEIRGRSNERRYKEYKNKREEEEENDGDDEYFESARHKKPPLKRRRRESPSPRPDHLYLGDQRYGRVENTKMRPMVRSVELNNMSKSLISDALFS